MLRKLIAILFLVVFVAATAYAASWSGPHAMVKARVGGSVLTDSTTYPVIDATGKCTTQVLRLKTTEKGNIFFQYCMDSDSIEVKMVLQQRMIEDSTRAWIRVDSATVSAAAKLCNFWVPTLKVPPVETRVIFDGLADNKKAGLGGTKVTIWYFRQE